MCVDEERNANCSIDQATNATNCVAKFTPTDHQCKWIHLKIYPLAERPHLFLIINIVTLPSCMEVIIRHWTNKTHYYDLKINGTCHHNMLPIIVTGCYRCIEIIICPKNGKMVNTGDISMKYKYWTMCKYIYCICSTV